MYLKMSGKTKSCQLIWVSVALCRKLLWLADHLESLPGILLLKYVSWGPDDADLVWYADACPKGMGFWSPRLLAGFQCHSAVDPHLIFYHEAYTVVSAFTYAATIEAPNPFCVVIHSDNSNTVDMFNSLHGHPDYNPLLLTVADISIKSNITLCVHHISGEYNIIADALSHFKNDVALKAAPGLSISTFQPPRLMLGQPKNEYSPCLIQTTSPGAMDT
jgi:hypothetical protein